ncbi:unnamed protein product [Clavelina lepadiformis]|uniref:Uncharacterized protein n=1 Tax=Clavelina lepadiformis TaxID=159417 RepID=A0ABP0G4P9_CLALP
MSLVDDASDVTDEDSVVERHDISCDDRLVTPDDDWLAGRNVNSGDDGRVAPDEDSLGERTEISGDDRLVGKTAIGWLGSSRLRGWSIRRQERHLGRGWQSVPK